MIKTDMLNTDEKLRCIGLPARGEIKKVNENPSKAWLLIIAVLTLTGAYLIVDDRKGDFYDSNTQLHARFTKNKNT